MVLVDAQLVAVALVTICVGAMAMRMARRTSSVVRRLGKNGQEMVALRHRSGAACDVYLHGATVSRYAVPNGHEVLWVSSGAVFNGSKAIRGGVPLVFPQFGPKADELLGITSMSQHGFARTSKWSVRSAEVRLNGDCQVVLTLEDSEATREKFPHKFSLLYTVSLNETCLRTALKMTNMDKATVAPQALLHTYFATDEVAQTRVSGLDGVSYYDQLADETDAQHGDVSFCGETDRVYERGDKLVISCEGQRAVTEIAVEATYVEEFGESGSSATPFAPDVVVWNPHVSKAKAMSDFDDDGWKRMLCVEPGILNKNRPKIAEGNSVILSQTITYIP
ncbi:hypothetical protein CTAYLR_001455 [Chrysophaeum taylorii]|uniref:glucose-6-phosphate 1-epimerase n=1 Tax=Chrysophaeum taylorii TaxID=2483200 RepID=A0AAD7U9N0_9STRA|nr:hypothetical protein CTAYLR_001455 [Chrysophaeum taylorii]